VERGRRATGWLGSQGVLRTRLVECAVGQREDVRAQNLEQVEGLGLVRLLLLDEFVHKLAQLRLTRVGYERLLPHDLIDEHLNVALGSEIEKVNRLGL